MTDRRTANREPLPRVHPAEGVAMLEFGERIRRAIKLAGDRVVVAVTTDKLRRILDRAHQAHS